MDKQRLTLAALTLLPLLAACGTEKAGGDAVGAGPDVTGVRWAVTDITVDNRTHKAPGTAHLRISADGRTEGNLGCNGFSSDADLDGDRVTFRELGATEMACENLRFEETFAKTLTDGTLTARAQGDHLTLTTADGDRVRLTEQKPAALAGTRWTITDPASQGRAHLVFDTSAGTVSGNAGCNRINAEATVRDGRITLGSVATTRMVCEGSLMHTERALLRVLDGTVDYRIDHRTLTLTSENGDIATAVAER
ncbi:META domain-containing protein [Streptomyces sp. enrichment culture]|uniref:META domain-containing protein n=1 Tax=Streptomyces sp. enrichment culture TaxID=1795815 RepID=UPI003F562500